MADVAQSFAYTMKFEDSELSGVVTKDPTKNDPNARARFGINSAAHPEAERDGFYEMSTEAALEYARDTFKYDYFSPCNGYQIKNQNVCNKIVDLAFNEGRTQAVKIVQRALNAMMVGPFNVDGVIGQRTLEGINESDPVELLATIKDKAKDFYVALAAANPQDQKDLNGWLDRLNA